MSCSPLYVLRSPLVSPCHVIAAACFVDILELAMSCSELQMVCIENLPLRSHGESLLTTKIFYLGATLCIPLPRLTRFSITGQLHIQFIMSRQQLKEYLSLNLSFQEVPRGGEQM